MKRFLILFLFLSLLVTAGGCSLQTRQDQVLESLGEYGSKQIWTHGEFQDYTDHGIYTYSSIALEQNEYFTEVSDEDVETLHTFLDDFENWVGIFRNYDPNDQLVMNYAFDRSVIDAADYFYLYQDPEQPQFSCYDLWIIDSQTNTLYYFHSNI